MAITSNLKNNALRSILAHAGIDTKSNNRDYLLRKIWNLPNRETIEQELGVACGSIVDTDAATTSPAKDDPEALAAFLDAFAASAPAEVLEQEEATAALVGDAFADIEAQAQAESANPGIVELTGVVFLNPETDGISFDEPEEVEAPAPAATDTRARLKAEVRALGGDDSSDSVNYLRKILSGLRHPKAEAEKAPKVDRRKVEGEKADKMVSTMLTATQLEQLDAAAARQGMTRSAIMRWALEQVVLPAPGTYIRGIGGGEG